MQIQSKRTTTKALRYRGLSATTAESRSSHAFLNFNIKKTLTFGQAIKSQNCNMQLLKCPCLGTARLIRRWGVFQHWSLWCTESLEDQPKTMANSAIAWTGDCSQGYAPSGALPQRPNPEVKSTWPIWWLRSLSFEENLRAFAQLRKQSSLKVRGKGS